MSGINITIVPVSFTATVRNDRPKCDFDNRKSKAGNYINHIFGIYQNYELVKEYIFNLYKYIYIYYIYKYIYIIYIYIYVYTIYIGTYDALRIFDVCQFEMSGTHNVSDENGAVKFPQFRILR